MKFCCRWRYIQISWRKALKPSCSCSTIRVPAIKQKWYLNGGWLASIGNIWRKHPLRGESLQLQPNVSGGIPPFSYLWNTGATTKSIVINAGGNYSVQVSNVCGIQSNTSVFIFEGAIDYPDGVGGTLPWRLDAVARQLVHSTRYGGAYASRVNGDCDTSLCLLPELVLYQPSVVSLVCPDNISLLSRFAIGDDDLPSAMSDCIRPGLDSV